MNADFENSAFRLHELPVLYVVRGHCYLVFLGLGFLELILKRLRYGLSRLLMLFYENFIWIEPRDYSASGA